MTDTEGSVFDQTTALIEKAWGRPIDDLERSAGSCAPP
jgi:hypothetical protein